MMAWPVKGIGSTVCADKEEFPTQARVERQSVKGRKAGREEGREERREEGKEREGRERGREFRRK